MRKKLLALVLFFFSLHINSQVVINEVDADNPGSDTKEFIELKKLMRFCICSYLHYCPAYCRVILVAGLDLDDALSASSSVERCGVWSVLYRLFSQNGVIVLRGQIAYPFGKKLGHLEKSGFFMEKINIDPIQSWISGIFYINYYIVSSHSMNKI